MVIVGRRLSTPSWSLAEEGSVSPSWSPSEGGSVSPSWQSLMLFRGTERRNSGSLIPDRIRDEGSFPLYSQNYPGSDYQILSGGSFPHADSIRPDRNQGGSKTLYMTPIRMAFQSGQNYVHKNVMASTNVFHSVHTQPIPCTRNPFHLHKTDSREETHSMMHTQPIPWTQKTFHVHKSHSMHTKPIPWCTRNPFHAHKSHSMHVHKSHSMHSKAIPCTQKPFHVQITFHIHVRTYIHRILSMYVHKNHSKLIPWTDPFPCVWLDWKSMNTRAP